MFLRTALALAFGLALSSLATADELPLLVQNTAPSQTALVQQLLALDDTAPQPWTPGEANSIVPIWSGSDGHLLAIVALPGQWGSSLVNGALTQPGPADWYLLGGTATPSSGLRWQAKNGFHIDALMSQSQSTLPALCGVDCEAGRPGGIAGSLGLGWMSADGGFDLSYGLSWLQSRDAAQGFQGIG